MKKKNNDIVEVDEKAIDSMKYMLLCAAKVLGPLALLLAAFLGISEILDIII